MTGRLTVGMKQVEKMRKRMVEIQEELANKRVEASSGGGMVIVVADGRQEILEVKIDPQVVDPDDVEMLEDLIVGAVNEARRRAQELAAEELSQLTGGFQIPGLMG